MRNLTLLSLLALGTMAAGAQEKLMRIHYTNGDTEVKKVADVSKITFENQGESPVDPTDQKIVDLGLSVAWATYNVGATAPEEYGGFYAYGEIEPKENYSEDTYKWMYWDYNDWDCDEWEKFLKLGADISGTCYDVAHMKWGEQWRMPSQKEWMELINNCSWTWTSVNGVAGAMGTSKVNGNTIFLPAAGNMVGSEQTHDGTTCFFWSSNEATTTDITADVRNFRANFTATTRDCGENSVDYPDVGFSIRAVYGPKAPEVGPDMNVPSESEMVDLGLSVKWAPYNLGANSQGTDGSFICWGELVEKYYSHTYNYKFLEIPESEWQHKWPEPKVSQIVDQISNTDEYDAAKFLWGDGWRIPTKAEMQELVDRCTWKWTGTGYTVTGPNGNSIFLKTSGFMTYKGLPRGTQTDGYYWCGDAEAYFANGNPDSSGASALRINSKEHKVGSWSRAGGIQIRPVHD